MELHHDLNMESRIVRFLVKKIKFLNSPCVKNYSNYKGVKNEYVESNIINSNKIVVLPSGSSIKKNLNFQQKKKFLKLDILDHCLSQED